MTDTTTTLAANLPRFAAELSELVGTLEGRLCAYQQKGTLDQIARAQAKLAPIRAGWVSLATHTAGTESALAMVAIRDAAHRPAERKVYSRICR